MKLTTIGNLGGVLAVAGFPALAIGIWRCLQGASFRRSGERLLLLGMLLWGGSLCLTQIYSDKRYGDFAQCKTNLKNLGTALEQYSEAHAGRYPSDLSELTPAYLKTLPSCPSAEANTYSSAYHRTPAQGERPDLFRLACSGHHHESASQEPNFPAYDSEHGLLSQ